MNYLQLHNKVLDRLREERIGGSVIGSNPYYNSIGAWINDAKEEVETAWRWSQLRDKTEVPLLAGQTLVQLPNSNDNQYNIQRILVKEKGAWLRWKSDDTLDWYNSNTNQVPVKPNVPSFYATGYPNDEISGNQVIQTFPPSNDDYTLVIDSWHTTDELVAETDLLKVPSLPVFALATALASRERGEVGGLSTSELFAKAMQYLSDAIAYDSARFPEEMDWYADDRLFNTNVRTA